MPLKIAHIHVWDEENKGDRGIVLAVQELLKENLGKIEIVDFPMEFLQDFSAQDLNKLNKCDIVVIGGGGILYHYFLPFNKEVINKIKLPIVIFGVGYIREIGSPALDQRQKDSVVALMKRATLIGVRDYYTKKFLVNNKIKGEKIKLIGDPAIFLSEKATSKFKDLDSDKIKIGLNLNYSGWLGFGRWHDDILSSYNKIAKYFQDKHQAEIYYLQHHPGEEVIVKQLQIKNLQVVNLPAREQKYIYGKLDLVVGMMLHSCVMAFGAGTLEINLAYDIRNRSFANFIKVPELLVWPKELKEDKLFQTVKQAFADQEKYQNQFARRKEYIRKQQQKFLQNINKLINK